jgi:probable phosphoglycerate mutase
MLETRAFWYLRHGETDWNVRNLAQGTTDVPLNAVGQGQAKAAAQLLRNRGIRTIVASPLSRARDTALAVGEAIGLPVQTDPELMEVQFGVREGEVMLAKWFDEWVAERSTPEGAESFAQLRTRAVRAINRALALAPPVLVVAHGAVFRALRSAMGLEPNIRTANGVPFFCEPGRDGTPWTLTAAT